MVYEAKLCNQFVLWIPSTDFLKAIKYYNQNCRSETCVKNDIKHVNLEKTLSVFPVSRSLVQNLRAQILKYFAQSWDCMIAAFRNSAHRRIH